MQGIKLNDISDSLLILHKATVDKLFQLENSADCIALYVFYYKTAKWQKSNVIKANDEYVKKCLKWGNDKIRKSKQTLKENGLINIVQARTDNKISGWYIEVCYLVSQKSTQDIGIKISDSKNSQNQQVAKPTSSNEETSALKEYIKCLKKEIEMLKNNILSEREEKENQNFDIVNEYKKICVSLPQTITLSPLLKSKIKTIENKYSFDKIKEVFKKAELSDFLKGSKGFKANFDWLMKDSNFAKVLDGNYDNKGNIQSVDKKSVTYDLSEYQRKLETMEGL